MCDHIESYEALIEIKPSLSQNQRTLWREMILNSNTEQCLPLQTISSMSSDLISIGVSSISTILPKIYCYKCTEILSNCDFPMREIFQNDFY